MLDIDDRRALAVLVAALSLFTICSLFLTIVFACLIRLFLVIV